MRAFVFYWDRNTRSLLLVNVYVVKYSGTMSFWMNRALVLRFWCSTPHVNMHKCSSSDFVKHPQSTFFFKSQFNKRLMAWIWKCKCKNPIKDILLCFITFWIFLARTEFGWGITLTLSWQSRHEEIRPLLVHIHVNETNLIKIKKWDAHCCTIWETPSLACSEGSRASI